MHARRAVTVYATHFAALVWLSAGCTPPTEISDGQFVGQQTIEICGNLQDDDGDGRVDCDDDQCEESCRGQLEAPFDVCGESVGDRGNAPVDMIWVLDGSVSMRDERVSVINNLSALAGVLDEKRADVRVVLLGGEDVCVGPPLGTAGCGDSDRYRHVVARIGNDNTLTTVIDRYADYQSFLRPESRRVLVAVSDDNPNPSPTPEWPNGVTPHAFDVKLRALNPAFERYIFHSIVGFSDDGGSHPNGCRGARRQGDVYLELTDYTRGLKFSVCNSRADAWRNFFEDVGNSVVGLVKLPCTYPLSVAFDVDQKTDPSQVMVKAEINGATQVLERFPGPESCGSSYGYYLVPGADELTVCPQVCDSIDVTRVLVQHACPGVSGPD